MVDVKITGLPEDTAPLSTDIVEIVSDPDGTPISKKVQLGNLLKEVGSFTPTIYDASAGGNQGAPSSATGTYIKSESLVYVEILLINIDTTGMTAGNDIYIRDLPYPPTSSNRPLAGSVIVEQITSSALMIGAEIRAEALSLVETISGAGRDFIMVSALSSGTADIRIAGWYSI